jgi:hypothetical protein
MGTVHYRRIVAARESQCVPDVCTGVEDVAATRVGVVGRSSVTA